MRQKIKDGKRIVIKVGTSTLTYDNGAINFNRIEKLSMVISDLCNMGQEVVLVSSGAVGIGCGKLRLDKKPETIKEKQAAAAVGQCELMHIYSKFFAEYGHVVAQILLTGIVLDNNEMKENVCATFETLIKQGIVPIVNENDAISSYEMENVKNFGDNDTLSAIVAKLVNADTLIILSDIDGFYDKDPRNNSDSKMIKEIHEITKDIEDFAGGAGTNRGTGGMKTKISAAKIATSGGTNMVLANGEKPEILLDIIEGKEIGTVFVGKKEV